MNFCENFDLFRVEKSVVHEKRRKNEIRKKKRKKIEFRKEKRRKKSSFEQLKQKFADVDFSNSRAKKID
jgi:hypothetical protein